MLFRRNYFPNVQLNEHIPGWLKSWRRVIVAMLCAREVWRWVIQYFDRKETGAGYPVLSQDIVVKRKTMACVLNFALLVLAFVSLAAATVPYETAYFEQKLDHFNFVQDKTFKQRYIYTGKSACIYCFQALLKQHFLFFLFKNYFLSNTPASSSIDLKPTAATFDIFRFIWRAQLVWVSIK